MKAAAQALMIGLMLATPACAEPAQQQDGPRLVLTGVGRFAVFADVSAIGRHGNEVRMRSLQVTEEDFTAGGETYWGGWSWWTFDCRWSTADRLDFASVREGGVEGPATLDTDPAGEADADNLADAVRIGRAALRLAN